MKFSIDAVLLSNAVLLSAIHIQIALIIFFIAVHVCVTERISKI